MSTEITKDIICPQCGESQKYKLYSSINADDNPELKKLILEETLFDWRCKRCNYFANMAYPFIYTQPSKSYILCFSPVGSTGTVAPGGAVENFIKRSVKNLPEMKEKILTFDNGFDDVAMELVKSALCDIIKGSYKVARLHAYFSRENDGELEFAIFLPGKKDPVYHSTKIDVYKQSQEVLRALNFSEPDGFAKVDAKMARTILRDYQED